MSKKWRKLLVVILAIGLLFGAFSFKPTRSFLASLIFPESITPHQLHDNYQKSKLKILIVPGHDEDSSGAQFRGIRESDLNLKMANELLALFDSDNHFKVFVTRDEKGYKSTFSTYMSENYSKIVSFRDRLRNSMRDLLRGKLIKRNTIVHHNYASEKSSIKLYGINKWANENDIDIVLHIHFNDDPTRSRSWAGKYSGFSIYVPEKQLPNHRASLEIADSIFEQMKKYFPVSDHLLERTGIVEDQELIAIGSNASLNSVALLIEYGYIYESQFLNPTVRQVMMKELAYQTHRGIKKYFVPPIVNVSHDTTTLPYTWSNYLRKGLKNNRDVFALQIALSQENLYPPSRFKENDCPLTGNFGRCTYTSVVSFQKKHSIPSTGFVGPLTTAKLNAIFGPVLLN